MRPCRLLFPSQRRPLWAARNPVPIRVGNPDTERHRPHGLRWAAPRHLLCGALGRGGRRFPPIQRARRAAPPGPRLRTHSQNRLMSTTRHAAPAGTKIRIEYDDTPVRQFMIASIFWGIIGMIVGVLIATQLAVWQANFGTSWLTFGRLRPLHTNAVIFAFVGNMM